MSEQYEKWADAFAELGDLDFTDEVGAIRAAAAANDLFVVQEGQAVAAYGGIYIEDSDD